MKLEEFKKGMKVKCIDNSDLEHILKKNSFYTLNEIEIVSLKEIPNYSFYPSRFEIVKK